MNNNYNNNASGSNNISDGSNPGNNTTSTNNEPSSNSMPMNMNPNKIAQLAQVLKNQYALAKAAGTDVAVRQQHLNRANQIRQILLNYQQQQRAARAAQGAGQDALGSQLQPAVAAPSTQQQPPQLTQDIPQQSPRVNNTYINTPSANSLGGGSPAIAQTPGPSQQQTSNSISGATPSTQGQTPGPGQASGANSAITVETYNQVRARLLDFQKKIQHLENSKRTYTLSTEQSANVESQLLDLTKKFTTYKKYAAYMKTQLDEQARASGQPVPSVPGTVGSVGGGSSITSGSPQMNNISTPAPGQFPRANSVQQSPQIGNQPMANTPNRGISQPQQQSGQGLPAGPQRGAVHTSNPNQQFTQATLASPAAGTSGPLPGAAENSSGPAGARVQMGRSASPPGVPAATAAAAAAAGATGAGSSSTGTPNRTSTPGGNGTSTSSGPPAINLSGITKPSVPSIPISSTINVKPPIAVTLKPNSNNNRATLMGGTANGVGSYLGTPALVKMPTYELAAGVGGEPIPDNGGRVLTKRKLNELVNTIGADEGDGKTNIDGDVEEILLDLADEFINSVTGFACRLAKHRKVESVDVKDIQLHLERNWNIRIPGYAMDEIKTTRRWQPSSSYSQKVSGVDISKSVNGNIK